ncbi:uncharacterized protein LOC120110629 [Phoenix dactylifera]|uniref:Uncharacterized protein LOC120110629 n=1 Tax=Phoenix dactylifera TaxID=42345 RepID=A0A8B9A8U0_PHODC|nr:uncharacterized protein LOC120110629 [Phoenix dactylifera]
MRIRDILEGYYAASGQRLNLAKFAVHFSPKTKLALRDCIRKILRVGKQAGYCRYMGVPIMERLLWRADYGKLEQSISKRLEGWQVALFLWKVAWESLLTRDMLYKRGVSFSPDCDSCLEEEESVEHALFGCPRAALVWRLTSVIYKFLQSPTLATTFLKFLKESMRRSADSTSSIRCTYIAYRIWLNKNARAFESRGQSLRIVVDMMLIYAVEYTHAATVDRTGIARDTWGSHSALMVPQTIFIAWELQLLIFLKVNFDSSMMDEKRRGGARFVIRSPNSSLIVIGGYRLFDTSVSRRR